MAKIIKIDTNQDGKPDTKVKVKTEISTPTATLRIISPKKHAGKLAGRKKLTPQQIRAIYAKKR